MVHILSIYKEHKEEIEKFLLDNIVYNSSTKLTDDFINNFFNIFKSLQTLFVTDKDYQQTKAKLFRNKKDTSSLPIDKVDFFKEKSINNGTHISSPYISISTGSTVITVIKKINEDYLVMSFELTKLLEEMDYVTHGVFFSKINKFMYATIGYGLYLLSAILILYSILTFGSYILYYNATLIESVFKSIVSITLGLAIFDLGKNLLEHEVIFRDEIKKNNSSKIFIKFLISIIVALSIESLIFVFKVILSKEYSDMIYALYLIGGVSILIVALSLFSKHSRN